MAQAEKITPKENNIKKHIDYINNQIYIENNNLKINRTIVLNYIKNNFNELNINKQFNTPEEYHNNIEISIKNMNIKLNSGWYKLDKEKGIVAKYQSRSGGFEAYYYWWGSQVYIHNQRELDNFKREIEDYIYRLETLGIWTAIPSLRITVILGKIHVNELKRMLMLVDRTYQDYGSVKITSHDFRIGDMFEVERIQ